MVQETYQDYHRNVLNVLSDDNIKRSKEIKEEVKKLYDYSDDELKERLSSGKNLIDNNINWSITYLFHAKTIERVGWGKYRITQRGKDLLNSNDYINNETLKQFSEFLEYINQSENNQDEMGIVEEVDTPNQIIDNNFNKLQKLLSEELLETIKNSSPQFFERLVVDLLLKMGYGGSREDAGEAIGKSGDEGIDGIIKEDILGLDNIYIQAKRWNYTIQRPEIQKFVGALSGKNASKGVFITTSKFSRNAITYAKNVNFTIILIDGEKLTNLMIDYNVGVSTESVYEIKKLDSDYFDEI